MDKDTRGANTQGKQHCPMSATGHTLFSRSDSNSTESTSPRCDRKSRNTGVDVFFLRRGGGERESHLASEVAHLGELIVSKDGIARASVLR